MKSSRLSLRLVSILALVHTGCGGSSGGGTDGGPGGADAEIAAPTAFRISSLNLRDPHVFVEVLGCQDATDTVLGQPGLNPSLNDAITMDGDNDGLLDLSLALVFRPLDQSRSTTPLEIHVPDCTAASTTCTAGAPPQLTTANNQSVECLAPSVGTTSGYNPGVVPVGPPCFASDQYSFSLTVQGTVITMRDTQVGATYNGTPAATLSGGLLKGFISEAEAQVTMLSLPAPIGTVSLASVLPGGLGNCDGGDDRDMNNGVSGWWMYFELTAQLVPWTE